MSALCVECDAELNISGRVRLGQHIICPNCGVQLEVISTHPIEVDIAYDESEEWDDLDGYGLEDEDEYDDLDEYAQLDGVRRRQPDDLDIEDFEEDEELDEFDVEDDDLLDADIPL